jgi:hypothetical protein
MLEISQMLATNDRAEEEGVIAVKSLHSSACRNSPTAIIFAKMREARITSRVMQRFQDSKKPSKFLDFSTSLTNQVFSNRERMSESRHFSCGTTLASVSSNEFAGGSRT